MMRIDVNSWYYNPDHGHLCQVIETQTLWGETTCRVWLPGSDSIVRIPASKLRLLEYAGIGSPDDIAYVAAAARVADTLAQDVLLAPIESTVIPLPHQIRALSRTMANDRVRYLLADEVGLGKTIEAGLIMRELKLRELVKSEANKFGDRRAVFSYETWHSVCGKAPGNLGEYHVDGRQVRVLVLFYRTEKGWRIVRINGFDGSSMADK